MERKNMSKNKVLMILTFGVMALTLNLVAVKEGISRPVIKGVSASTVLGDKRCEKCKRGPDGKMECETVPCPK
jgi:hypothetical protein